MLEGFAMCVPTRLPSLVLSCLFAAASTIAGMPPVAADTLKVGGTGAITELLSQLVAPFKAATGTDLDVVAGLGTSGANNAVASGKLGLSVSGRELRDAEKAKGLKIAGAFRTPFGLVTSRKGPDTFKAVEIAGLYRADAPTWPDGTPVLIMLRPTDESDNDLLGQSFPGMADALLLLRKRRDISIAATDQDNAETAEKVKGSLTGASLVQVTTEKRNLRFVSIDGVAVTLENYLDGTYPHAKTLYIVVPAAPGPEALAFIAFLATPASVALLRQAGVIAAK